MKNPINTAPLDKFVQLVATMKQGDKELRLQKDEALRLSLAITQVLGGLVETQQELISLKETANEVIEIQVEGGRF